MPYLLLALSILFEVAGTSLMKATEGFTKLWPTVALLICYSISFCLVSQVVKTIPLGIVYATWSAVGIVLVAAVGYFVYKQALDFPALLGMSLIILGVVVLNVFSRSSVH
ncbi:MAG: QacE family quaternary ammonium compound efflux SMR transporter [Proteobacteria bacterium]|nr:MAG: QacE family quaternary ammonium compound efflux SMR transporter [Pseudomonadota bacterium]